MAVTAMAIGAVAAPVIGGLMGNAAASKSRAQQKAMIKKAIQELEKLGVPPDLSSPLILQNFESAGLYTPEMEQDLNDSVSESEVGKITEDSSLRDAQKSALTTMQQRAKVGLSAEDRAALNQVRQQVQQDSQAKQSQILQEMQARGQGGGGAELAARLTAGQAGADRASSASDTLMAQAQERALQALGQSANLAGEVRGQDFNVANTKASALDERNRFLAQNSISRQTRNVGAMNTAEQQNLANKQSIMSANTQQANAESLRQRNEQGAFFDRKAQLAGQKAAAQVGAAGQYANMGNQQAGMFAGIGNAVGTGLGAIAQYQANKPSGVDAAGGTTQASADYLASDKDLKENVDYTDDDVQKWLDSLSTRILRKKM